MHHSSTAPSNHQTINIGQSMAKSNVIYFRKKKKKRAMCRFLIAFLGIDGGQIIDNVIFLLK